MLGPAKADADPRPALPSRPALEAEAGEARAEVRALVAALNLPGVTL